MTPVFSDSELVSGQAIQSVCGVACSGSAMALEEDLVDQLRN